MEKLFWYLSIRNYHVIYILSNVIFYQVFTIQIILLHWPIFAKLQTERKKKKLNQEDNLHRKLFHYYKSNSSFLLLNHVSILFAIFFSKNLFTATNHKILDQSISPKHILSTFTKQLFRSTSSTWLQFIKKLL